MAFTVEPCQSEPDSSLNTKRRTEKLKHNLFLGSNKLALLHFVQVTFYIAQSEILCHKNS